MESTSRALVGPTDESLDLLRSAGQAPHHFWFSEPEQYVVRVQRYSRLPAEVVVLRRTFHTDVDRYMRAAEAGLANVPSRRYGPRVPNQSRTSESIEHSQWRARKRVRQLVTELAPNQFVTLSTRPSLTPQSQTIEGLAAAWADLLRRCRQAEPTFKAVCVPERHPTNPDHLHLHVAVRSRLHHATLRRLWHIALMAREGRRVFVALKGPASPGGVNVRWIKGANDATKIRKTARYIAKYVTKDSLVEFNRKRYWASKGIELADAAEFWLESLSMGEAIEEACRMFGHWDEVAPAFRVWRPPGDRVASWHVEDAGLPTAPF